MNSSTRILLGLLLGLVLGIAVDTGQPGWLQASISVVEPIGRVWLDALRMTIVPLVFSLLVTGIASTAATASAGGLAARSLAWFLVVLLAVAFLGQLMVVLFLGAWPIPVQAAAALREGIAATDTVVPTAASISVWLSAIMPANPIKAAADGEMLPLVIFALIFGFAVTRVALDQRRRLVDFFEALVAAMLVIVHWVILVAPLGVFALAYVVGARAGFAAAGALAHYLVLLVVVQVVLIALIYPLVAIGAKVPLLEFARAVAPAQAVAASTQSSLASLPAMVESAQQLRVPAPVASLVLPLAVAVFRFTSPIANLAVALYSAALFGVELTAVHYIAGAIIALLMSVASVGLPGQVSFFASVAPICLVMGVPVLALPLLLAVETIPDIFRTVGNVTADVGMSAVLARRQEGAVEPAAEALP